MSTKLFEIIKSNKYPFLRKFSENYRNQHHEILWPGKLKEQRGTEDQ